MLQLVGWGCAESGQLGPVASEVVAVPHPLPGVPPGFPVDAAAAGLSASVLVGHGGAPVLFLPPGAVAGATPTRGDPGAPRQAAQPPPPPAHEQQQQQQQQKQRAGETRNPRNEDAASFLPNRQVVGDSDDIKTHGLAGVCRSAAADEECMGDRYGHDDGRSTAQNQQQHHQHHHHRDHMRDTDDNDDDDDDTPGAKGGVGEDKANNNEDTRASSACPQAPGDDNNSNNATPDPSYAFAAPRIAAVAAGADYCLYVSVAGTLLVSGTGGFGQLAHGPDVAALPTPTVVPELAATKIVAVAAGAMHWLALDAAARVHACGHNASGQCGNGTTDNIYAPVGLTALWHVPVVHITAGDRHSAVLSATGDIFCFGSNKLGQVGQPAFHIKVCALYPTLVPVPVPVPGPGPHTSRSPSPTFDASQATDAEGDTVMTPSPAVRTDPPLSTPNHREVTNEPAGPNAVETTGKSLPAAPLVYIDVACGDMHTVALRSDGAVVCWGQGEHGQVGSQSTANAYGPVLARPPPSRAAVRFVAVSAGSRHSAAVAEDGTAFLWGDGSLGQIGDGEMAGKLRPVPLPPLRMAPIPGDMDSLPCRQTDSTQSHDHAMALAGPSRTLADLTVKPFYFVQVICGAYHNLAFVSQIDPPKRARQAFGSRVPLVDVDQMVSAKAGMSRFGSSAALYRSFVEPVPIPVESMSAPAMCVRTEKLVKAYSSYGSVFGLEGKTYLGRAAAKLRHEAQAAFGMRKPDMEREIFTSGYWDKEGRPLVTPSDEFAPEDAFRCEVADMRDAGIVLFLAILNPVYQDKSRLKELGEITALIVRLRRDAREAFVICAQFALPELLAKCIIRPLQFLISEELRNRHRVTKHATNATKVLGLCHRGNEERKRTPTSLDADIMFDDDKTEKGLPAEEFYNENVSVMIDLQEDWARWNKANADFTSRTGEQSSRPEDFDGTGRLRDPPFSFCEHSFILNKFAKYKLLGIEAHNVMDNEAYRAWLSFGSVAMPMNLSHVANMGFLVLHVRRSSIVADTFARLSEIMAGAHRDLHKTLKVVFEDEEGLDEGGVRKEFFQVLMSQLMSPDYGMFEYHPETRFHWFRRDSLEEPGAFMLVGIAVGLALFNSTLLDIQFPPVIYRKLHAAVQYARQHRNSKTAKFGESHYSPTLGDVAEVYPAIANSLRHLLHYEGTDVENVFGLTYEVPYEGLFGKPSSAELIPGGANVAVTAQNKYDFVKRYMSYLVNDSIETVFQQFAKGLLFMLSGPFVGKLTAEELQTLVIGEKELDFEALRATCRYEGYTVDSPVIQNLWTVLFELDQPMRQKFLSFVTGSDRAPIGGLGNLGLIIQNAGGDTDRLPTSHTCFNVLLLPDYATRAKLRSLLLLAIQNSEGFFLR